MSISFPTLASAANSGGIQTQRFLLDGTWTRPAGVTTIQYRLVGGGGAGGSAHSSYTYSGGGGGAGGFVLEGTLEVNNNVTITIGEGGLGGANLNGQQGGDSTMTMGGTTFFTAYGGGGGGSGAGSAPKPANGGNGGGGGTDLCANGSRWCGC